MKRRRARRHREPRIVLLGPQAEEPELEAVLDDLAEEGAIEERATVATITAGWREREGEAEFVPPVGPRPHLDLRLYERTETLSREDPELAAAHRATQDRLKLLRRSYNLRLAGLMNAVRDVSALQGDPEVLDAEREAALAMVRALDDGHLAGVAEIRSEYEERWRPASRPGVVRQREEIEAALEPVGAIVIAGGHVATLANRLRLFGIAELVRPRPIIAWSAGAMTLASRIVLFHDRPPWGPGNAEAFDHGLGLARDLILLPHAAERLALDDRARTGRLARRFAPDVCVLLDRGARLDFRRGTWEGRDVKRLDRLGRQVALTSRRAA